MRRLVPIVLWIGILGRGSACGIRAGRVVASAICQLNYGRPSVIRSRGSRQMDNWRWQANVAFRRDNFGPGVDIEA